VPNPQTSGKIGAVLIAAVVVLYLLVSPARTDRAPATISASPSPVSGCSSAKADAMVRAFVATFNTGQIDDLLSSAFVWVSFDAAHEVAYGHDAGLQYLHQRQASGDRLDLKNLQVGSEKSWDGAWGFGFAATLTRAGSQYDGLGKGELYCDGSYPGISLWSMGLTGR